MRWNPFRHLRRSRKSPSPKRKPYRLTFEQLETRLLLSTLSVVSGSGQSATVGTPLAEALEARLTDDNGNPVPGVVVTFTAPASGPGGSFYGAASAGAYTDANGIATSEPFTVNTRAGAYSLAASAAGVTVPASFSETNAPAAPAQIGAVAGSGQSATVATPFAAPLQVLVTDAYGNPVPGAPVAFTAPTSAPGGSFYGAGTASAATGPDGVATSPLFTADYRAGSYSVTASAAGLTPTSFSLTNAVGAPTQVTALTGSGQSATVGTQFAAPLKVLVSDAYGNPVAGTLVTFTAPASGPGGSFYGGGTATVLTGADGTAASLLFTADTQPGAYDVTAEVAGAATSFSLTNAADFSLTNTVGAPAYVAPLAGSGQSAAAGTLFAAPLRALVTDAYGNPVPGVIVTFSTPASGPGGTFHGAASAPAYTDANGFATSDLLTANGQLGGYDVTASVAGVAAGASFALTNTAGAPAHVTAQMGSGQSATVGTPFAAALQARVTDPYGNPVPGVIVTFAAPASGAGGSFQGAPTTSAYTDANGLAASGVLSANGLPGGYGVTASVAGVAAVASFALTNTAVAVSAQSATAGTITVLSPGDQANREGDAVALVIQATDAGGGTLLYAATGLPDGLTIDLETGIISGTVDSGGSYQATVLATDGTSSASLTFTWVVNGPVAVPNPGDRTNHEGDIVTLQPQASDPTGGTLAYAAFGLPDGLTIDRQTGLISGTISPGAAAYGPFVTTVTARDGIDATNDTFTWNVCSPVAVTNPGAQSNGEGDAVSLQVQAADATGGTLTYAASGLPDGLTIDPATGLISGTINPGAAADGPLLTVIAASDGTYSNQQTLTWNVAGPVTVVNPGDQSDTEGAAVALQIQAADATGSTLSYSATGLPEGLTINSITGLISGTITDGTAGDAAMVTTVTAADGTSAAQQTFTWDVRDAVSVTNPGDQSSVAGMAVTLAIQATDANPGSLTYSATGLPDGLMIDPRTGLISGTLRAATATDTLYDTTVTASDGISSDEQTFAWDISNPITVSRPDDQVSTAGDSVSLQIEASGAGGTLTYSASGLPAGLSIDPGSGLIAGTVGAGGFYRTTVTAGDGTSLASITFTWNVIAPVAVEVPDDQSNTEGDIVSVQLGGSDATGDTLTYSASGLPEGLAIDPTTGLISGTLPPGAAAGGPFVVVATVTDGSYSDTDTFNWEVLDPVTVTGPGDQHNAAGDMVSLLIDATDAGGGTLVYSASGLPIGLSLDPATGLISGTIIATDGPSWPTTVTASDGTYSDTQTFSWSVSLPVTLTSPGDQAGTDGDRVTLEVEASDPAGGDLTFSATGLPDGLVLNPYTGLIFGVISPGAAADGPYSATVTVSDGLSSASQSFNWSVSDPVTVTGPGDQSSTEGDTVSLQVQPSDSRGGIIFVYTATGLPDGLTIDAQTGLISGTVCTGAALNGPFAVTVTASDGTYSADATFTWDVNSPLTVTDPGDQSNALGDGVSLQLEVSDPVGGAPAYAASGLPSGLTIDPNTGLISGTLDATGSYQTTVTASDGNSSAAQTFTWIVSAAGTSSPIRLTSPGDQGNTEGDTVALSIQATDSAGGTLTYSALGLPDGLSIDASTGQITGTISAGASADGPFVTTVTADDGTNTAEQTFDWTVSSPVAIPNPGDQTNTQGDTVSLQVQASDSRGGTLTYAATGLPDGLGIDTASGLISGTITPGNLDSGLFVATVTASDGTYSAEQTIRWTVAASASSSANPIALTSPGDQTGAEGDTVSLPIQAADYGGGALTYTATGLPDGLTIDADTGLISGTVSAGAAANGPLSTTVTAGDGTDTADVTFTWHVNSLVSITDPGDQGNGVGDAVSLQIKATDSDGGTLAYAASELPGGLAIDPNKGLISGTITTAGSFDTTVTISAGSASTSQTFTWTVTAAAVSSPIRLANPGDQSNAEGDIVALQLQATDSAGATLTYAATGLPTGLTIDAETGMISGTLSAGAAAGGPFAITITASDGASSVQHAFHWAVRSPVAVVTLRTETNRPGDAVSLQVQASDSRGGTLTFAATGLPDGLSIDPATGLISGTISTTASAGNPFTATVTATDGTYSAARTFYWVVQASGTTGANSVTMASPGDRTNMEGDLVSLPVEAADYSGLPLTYAATGLPTGLTIDAGTGLISGTISAGASAHGPFTTTVTATDGSASAQQTFRWTVNSAASGGSSAGGNSTQGGAGAGTAPADFAPCLPPAPPDPTAAGGTGLSFAGIPTNPLATLPSDPGAVPGTGPASGSSAVPPPSGASGTAPGQTATIRVTAGGYHRHYTESGQSSDGSYYLDVVIDSQFSDSGSGGTAVESGTITATGWLELYGVVQVAYDNVVTPFTNPLAGSSGFSFRGLPGPGPLPGYDLAGFGLDTITSYDTTWDDSSTFDARGTLTAGNGKTYPFTSESASTIHRDGNYGTSSVITPGPQGGSSDLVTTTTVNGATWNGTYRTDVTASDNAGNLSADPQYDDNGLPLDLFDDPAAGTTYLARTFDTGAYSGNSKVTTVSTQQTYHQTVSGHSQYGGDTGQRYYVDSSQSVDRSTAADPATDKLTWNIDVQAKGDYDGTQDVNHDSTKSGAITTVTTRHVNGNFLQNLSDFTDVYHRESGLLTQDGTFHSHVTGNGKPATYDRRWTDVVVLGLSGATASTLSYRMKTSSDSKLQATDEGRSQLVGQTRTWTDSSTSTRHTDSNNDVLLNRLSETAAVDRTTDYNGSSSFLNVAGAVFSTADGSLRADGKSTSTGASSFSGKSNLDGHVNSSGQQIDGTSYDSSNGSSSGKRSTTTTLAAEGDPQQVTTSRLFDRSSTRVAADLRYRADGTASGTVTADGTESGSGDTTTTLAGAIGLPDGSGRADDRTVRHTTYDNTSNVDMTLNNGDSSGTVKNRSHDTAVFRSWTDHRLDRNHDLLHATILAGGSGAVATTNILTTTVTSGKQATVRTFTMNETGQSHSNIKANGKLSDSQGHAGSWTFDATAQENVDNRVVIRANKAGPEDTGWKETEREFHVNEKKSADTDFHQNDDGLGRAPSPPGVAQTSKHSVWIRTWERAKDITDGTPEKYAFVLLKEAGGFISDDKEGTSNNAATGDGYSYHNRTGTGQSFRDEDEGTDTAGVVNETRIDYSKYQGNSAWRDNTVFSPKILSHNHHEDRTVLREWRRGTTQSGVGSRILETYSRSWGETLDKSSGRTTTWGDPEHEPTLTPNDLSWPGKPSAPPSYWDLLYVVWDTSQKSMASDPIFRWLMANGSDVARAGFGAFDVGLGGFMIFSSGGLLLIPGLGLMAVGLDQLYTGAENMLSGRPLPSVFEYLGYQGARAAGLGEGESQIIGALTPAALSVAFAGLAGWLNAGRAAPSRLFVYLTEEQYQEVVNAGRLGKGYRGWWRVFGPPFDEGRVWATTYTPEQMKGISGIFRAMSAGIEPWRLSKLTRVIEIGEEAAGAFGTPFGPGFSLNPIGWGKGILGNQWQFRGTLAFAGSPITSLAGYGSYTTGQMIVFRMGELLRFGIYTGTPVATAIAIDRYFKPY